MVRRVGFGGNDAPERRISKPRPERKIEKFHLEGAHDADMPASKPNTPRPAKPERKPISRKRFWFYLIFGMWFFPMVIGGIFNITNFLIYEVNIVPLTFFWIFALGFGAYRLIKYFKITLSLVPITRDDK